MTISIRHATAVALLAMSGAEAAAVTTLFSGQDDGAGSAGSFKKSAAAEAAFLAAAAGFGTVLTETFETREVGYYSPIPVFGGLLTFDAPDFGEGYSGISAIQLDGRNTGFFGFNITRGGSHWFGFPNFTPDGVATFTFLGQTNSFGFWATGVQADFTASIRLVQADGNQRSFALPLNRNGGASYFGITDTVGFTSVSIINTSVAGEGDAWGIDDVSYNEGAAVPEPATWALLIAGFGVIGCANRNRRTPPRVAA